MDRLRMVPLARGLSDFEAKVLTARLGAEGIIWQVRGVVDSVYPLGDIDVLVPDVELIDAQVLLQLLGPDEAPHPWLERDDESDTDADTEPASGSADRVRVSWWLGATLIGLLALWTAARFAW